MNKILRIKNEDEEWVEDMDMLRFVLKSTSTTYTKIWDQGTFQGL